MAFGGVDIGDILNRYAGGQQGDDIEQDFDQVARNTGSEDLEGDVADAFRSDQTPPFGEMVGQLFGNASPDQRVGLFSQLLTGAGPGLIGSLLGQGGGRGMGGFLGDGAGMGAMGALLGQLVGQQPQQATLSAEDMGRLSPEQVQELALHAERENPGVIEHLSRFVAQNPDMLKALGGGTLAYILGRMARRRS